MIWAPSSWVSLFFPAGRVTWGVASYRGGVATVNTVPVWQIRGNKDAETPAPSKHPQFRQHVTQSETELQYSEFKVNMKLHLQPILLLNETGYWTRIKKCRLALDCIHLKLTVLQQCCYQTKTSKTHAVGLLKVKWFISSPLPSPNGIEKKYKDTRGVHK